MAHHNIIPGYSSQPSLLVRVILVAGLIMLLAANAMPPARADLATSNAAAASEAEQAFDQCHNSAPDINPDDTIAACSKAIEPTTAGSGHDCCLARAYRQRGRAFLALKQYDDALSDFEAAQKLQPDDAQFHDAKARILSEKGDTEQALTEADMAIAFAPHETKYRMTRVLIYLETKNSKGAIDDLTAVLARSSQPEIQAQTYALRGYAYQLEHQSDAALSDYNKALTLSPDLSMALVGRASIDGNAGKYDLALSGYERVLRRTPKNPSALLGRGAIRSRLGDYQQALDDINAAILLSPPYPPAYLERGIALAQLGKMDQGVVAIKTAIRMAPDQPSYHAYLGNLYAMQGNLTLAMTEAKTATTGTDPLAGYLALSRIGIFTGDDQMAIDNARAAVTKDPSSASYEYLIEAQREAGDYQAALATANAALKSDSQNGALLGERGFIYALSHQGEKARNDFSKTAELDHHASRYVCFGFALVGDGKQAQAACDAAIAATPTEVNALLGRAYLRLVMRDWHGARDDYDKAAELWVASAAVLFGRGYARERLGDANGAAQDYAAAKQVNPKIAERYARIGVVPGKDTVEPPAR